MIRLSLLVAAFLISFGGLRLLAGADAAEGYLLRDGLLLALVGGAFFAWLAAPPMLRPTRHAVRAGSRWGRVIWLTGTACSVAGGLLFVPATESALFITTRTTLWLLGLLLSVIGLWWQGAVRSYSRPAYRWDRDPDGGFVRRPLHPDDTPADDSWRLPRSGAALLLLGIMVLAAFMRFWQLDTVPPSCVGAECSRALDLTQAGVADLPAMPVPALDWLAAWLSRLTGDGLVALRMVGGILGVLTVPLLYVAARRFTGRPIALAAALVLALHPWAVAAARTSDPGLAAALLVTLAAWMMGRAYRSQSAAHWGSAGLAVGLLLLSGPPLQLAGGLWLLLVVAAALPQRTDAGEQRIQRTPLLAPLTALAVGLAGLVTVGEGWSAGYDLAGSLLLLLNGQMQSAGSIAPLVGSATAGLAVLGVLSAAAGLGHRHAPLPERAVTAALVAGGVGLFLLAGGWTAAPLPALLPLLLLAGAVAAETILGRAAVLWAPVLPPARLAASLLALVLAAGVFSAATLFGDLGRVRSSTTSGADQAMARYINERSAQDETILFVTPARFLSNPTVRLMLGPVLEAGRVRAFDGVGALVVRSNESTGREILVPASDRGLLELVQLFYPQVEPQIQFDDRTNPDTGAPVADLLFYIYPIDPTVAGVPPGLRVRYAPGDGREDSTGDAEADDQILAQALTFDWGEEPPLAAPFTARWSGSLVVPVAGTYLFRVAGLEQEAILSLRLDDTIVLDTSLGVTEKAELLAAGVYDLEMELRSGPAPADFSVLWQPPGAPVAPVPVDALLAQRLPNVGLRGVYYPNDRLQPPALELRKDLLVGQARPDAFPYSVEWQGKLAAPRAGETVLAVLADGAYQLSVNDQVLVDSARQLNPQPDAPAGDSTMADYAQASIYLPQGWHDLTVRFVPNTPDSTLQLLWHPPGSYADILTPRYLTPVQAPLQGSDLALPQPPALTDSRLADGAFALTQGVEDQATQMVIPPRSLPQLGLSLLWQTPAVCGNAAGQLDQPHGVAVDGEQGRIFVADTANQRIAVYDLDGNPLAPLRDAGFQEPFDVALGNQGLVLVLDALAQEVFALAPDGSGGTQLALDGGFYRPRGLSSDPLGLLAVADTGGGRAVLFEAAGGELISYGGPNTPLGRGQPVDVLLAGNRFWAISAEDGRLWELNSQGSMVAIQPTDTLNGPHLTGLPDGSFFLSDPARRLVQYHLAGGEPMGQLAYPDQFIRPTGVGAALLDGRTYLAVVDSQACSLSLWRGTATGMLP